MVAETLTDPLCFSHRTRTQSKTHPHIWHWVYLHGEAEDRNGDAFAEGGEAPDLCCVNRPLSDYVPCDDMGRPTGPFTMRVIECQVDGDPGIVVLAVENGVWQGRVALCCDAPAVKHALTPSEWR